MYPLTSTNQREELMITLYNYSSRLSIIIIILDWHWANSGGVGVEPRRGLSWFHSNELMHLTHKLGWYKLQIRLLAALAAVDDEVLPLILTYSVLTSLQERLYIYIYPASHLFVAPYFCVNQWQLTMSWAECYLSLAWSLRARYGIII